MRNDALGTLTPGFKAAIFLLSLDPNESARLFNELTRVQAEAVSMAIAGLPAVSASVRHDVLLEFLGSSSAYSPVQTDFGCKKTRTTQSTISRLVELEWLPGSDVSNEKRPPNTGNGYITAIKKS